MNRFTRFLNQLFRIPSGNNRQKELVLLGQLGNMLFASGEISRAVENYEKALSITRELGDKHSEASTLSNLGNAYVVLGDIQKAIELYQRALSLVRVLGNRMEEGNILNNIGLVYEESGELHNAVGYFEQSLSIAQEMKDRQREGSRLSNLGNTYAKLGQQHRAVEFFERALKIAHEVQDLEGQTIALSNLANVFSALRKYEKAIEYYQQSLKTAQSIGDRRAEYSILNNLGNVHIATNKHKDAIAAYEKALAIAREIGNLDGEASSLANLGNVYKQLGERANADPLFQEAITVSEKATNVVDKTLPEKSGVKTEGEKSRLVSIFNEFANSFEFPYKSDEKKHEAVIGLPTGTALITTTFHFSDDGYEFGAALGKVNESNRKAVSEAVMTSSPEKGITERILDDKLIVLGSREGLGKLTDEEIQKNLVDDIARISSRFDDLASILDYPVNISTKKVDINVATQKTLASLPGIGPKLAERIVKYRSTYGGFLTIGDLLKIPGLTNKDLVKIRDKIKI